MTKIIIVLVLLLLSSCDSHKIENRYITIVNNSNHKIYVRKLTTNDTNENRLFCLVSAFPVSSNSKFDYDCGRNCDWSVVLDKHYNFVMFWVVEYETFWQYFKDPCDTTDNIPSLHRYQLTLQDLQRMNWTVVYPPEEECDGN
jgi:hypothetical protein